MSRRRVDLGTLPIWLRYLISLTVVGIVVAVALLVADNTPVPPWITTYLLPFLSGLVAVVLVLSIVGRHSK